MMLLKYKELLLLLLSIFSVHGHAVPKANLGFSVSGTTIYDGTGAAFMMRGVSFAYTWFKNDLETSVPAIAETGANIVRVVLSNGAQWTKDDAASVEKVISLLSENKMITMLEVHDAIGVDDTEPLDKAVDYWIEIKSVLQASPTPVLLPLRPSAGQALGIKCTNMMLSVSVAQRRLCCGRVRRQWTGTGAARCNTGATQPLAWAKCAVITLNYLQGKEDRVIINIANEWYTKDNADAWGEAYQAAVKKLRDAGLTHLFVIDAAGWGQYPDVIPAAGPAIFEADSLKNTVFSIHMYEVAGKDMTAIKTGIDNALAINIPVIVGEFATTNNGQPVDMDSILSYTEETSVGWLAWSWYGNNDPALDMATGAAGSLTTYGEKVVNGDNGLKATSVLSKIFD
ncbi:hypothetical protein NQ318_022672 [Aromia moschata]|uniref:Glycoside hydrolase family 5 domain-containing protein n=1 Tax=Aromia moschata TaxID=1265417 RepID=A0AAV8YLU6_9CUCU|nr:hypothetical protein NQ318_022672 [Aromia moschata]